MVVVFVQEVLEMEMGLELGSACVAARFRRRYRLHRRRRVAYLDPRHRTRRFASLLLRRCRRRRSNPAAIIQSV